MTFYYLQSQLYFKSLEKEKAQNKLCVSDRWNQFFFPLLNQIYEVQHWQFWTFKTPSNLDYDQSIIPPSKFRTSQENNGMTPYKFNGNKGRSKHF